MVLYLTSAGYQLLADVNGMPTAYQHLRVRLRIEQGRLLNWGEKVGLVEGLLERPDHMPGQELRLNRNVVIDLLLEIQALIKSCVKTTNKYDKIVPIKSISVNEEAPFDRRFPNGTNTILRKVLNIFEKAPEVGTRLQWATVKQDSFKDCIQKLIGYNEFIEALLDRNSMDQLQAMQHQTFMVMLQLNTKVDELRQMSLAMQVRTRAPSGDTEVGLSRSSTIVTDHDKQNDSVALLADFKASSRLVERQTSTSDVVPIPKSAVKLETSRSTRSQGFYQGRLVWVEWKTYDFDETYPLWWDAMIEERVKKLVILLKSPNTPKQFRSPQCIGFVHDKSAGRQEYGFLYERPNNAMPSSVPISLHELMKTTKMPSLTRRMAIAFALAQSLLYLHSVDWLHKGIRSDNVVFFVGQGKEPDYREPVLSGFEYARPDMAGELTEPTPKFSEYDLYRHPNFHGSVRPRSKKSDDVYSMSVVLVEIAHWRSISEIINIPTDRKAARAAMKGARATLMDEDYLDVVEGLAGDVYKEVVRRGLTGWEAQGLSPTADERDPEVGASMLQVYSTEIVGRLESIRT